MSLLIYACLLISAVGVGCILGCILDAHRRQLAALAEANARLSREIDNFAARLNHLAIASDGRCLDLEGTVGWLSRRVQRAARHGVIAHDRLDDLDERLGTCTDPALTTLPPVVTLTPEAQ